MPITEVRTMPDNMPAPERVERREISTGNGYFVRDNGPLFGWGLHDEDGYRVAVFTDEWCATTFAAITDRKAAIALADREAAEHADSADSLPLARELGLWSIIRAIGQARLPCPQVTWNGEDTEVGLTWFRGRNFLELSVNDDGTLVWVFQEHGVVRPGHHLSGDEAVRTLVSDLRTFIGAAERVEAGPTWEEYEQLRDAARRDLPIDKLALDAFMRRLLALAEAGRAVPENLRQAFVRLLIGTWQAGTIHPLVSAEFHEMAEIMGISADLLPTERNELEGREDEAVKKLQTLATSSSDQEHTP